MTAADVIDQLKVLPPDELDKVRDWLVEQDEESPEMPEALDIGIRSLEEGGVHIYTREELESKVREWAGGSS